MGLLYFCCMYSKQEASQIRKDFWTSFGQYMSPILSVDGEKISWINYKTGEKNISFRMQADNRLAVISIELSHPDKDIQQLYFEQFQQLKNIFKASVKEDWAWVLHTTDENGKTVSRIYAELQDVSIFKREDWPQLISFFKPRMVALDDFWSNVRYSFEALR